MAVQQGSQHKGWEAIWSSGEHSPRFGSFAAPNDTVVEWAENVPKGASVVDIGCGIGRHVTYLGRLGFKVAGSDVSPKAIEMARQACEKAGITFDGRVADMTAQPWANNTFDAALSTSAIYHGLRSDIEAALNEIWRILKPGGQFLVDFKSNLSVDYAELKRRVQEGTLKEIEPDTFRDERPEPEDDLFLPHHFCSATDAHILLSQFVVLRFGQKVIPTADGRELLKWICWVQKPSPME